MFEKVLINGFPLSKNFHLIYCEEVLELRYVSTLLICRNLKLFHVFNVQGREDQKLYILSHFTTVI